MCVVRSLSPAGFLSLSWFILVLVSAVRADCCLVSAALIFHIRRHQNNAAFEHKHAASLMCVRIVSRAASRLCVYVCAAEKDSRYLCCNTVIDEFRICCDWVYFHLCLSFCPLLAVMFFLFHFEPRLINTTQENISLL